jgi:hypothetical protein
MSMIFHCTKHNLSNKCNSSWVVSIKEHMHFNFKPPPWSFFCCCKSGAIKVVYPLKIFSIQNFMVSLCLVTVLHPSQRFERPPFWNGWSYEVKNYGAEVTFSGTTSLLNIINNPLIGSKLTEGTGILTGRWSHKSTFFPLGRKVG